VGQAQLEAECNQALLGAVVQIAFDAASAATTIRAREAVSAAWASALAIAVPMSSVKPASRASVSAGSGSCRVDATNMTPHGRPSTLIGTPTDARMPDSRLMPDLACKPGVGRDGQRPMILAGCGQG
jgi:hypothetical protein